MKQPALIIRANENMRNEQRDSRRKAQRMRRNFWVYRFMIRSSRAKCSSLKTNRVGNQVDNVVAGSVGSLIFDQITKSDSRKSAYQVTGEAGNLTTWFLTRLQAASEIWQPKFLPGCGLRRNLISVQITKSDNLPGYGWNRKSDNLISYQVAGDVGNLTA